MPEENNSIFRSQAILNYIREREETVLPRWIRPPVFKVIWLLVALILAAGLTASLIRIPIMASGQGLMMPSAAAGPESSTRGNLVLFLPASVQGQVQAGQAVHIQNPPAAHTADAVIVAVESSPLSPEAVYNRFPGAGTARLAIRQPQTIALASWRQPSQMEKRSDLSGSLFNVRVQTGFVRFIHYLPGLKSLFKEGGV